MSDQRSSSCLGSHIPAPSVFGAVMVTKFQLDKCPRPRLLAPTRVPRARDIVFTSKPVNKLIQKRKQLKYKARSRQRPPATLSPSEFGMLNKQGTSTSGTRYALRPTVFEQLCKGRVQTPTPTSETSALAMMRYPFFRRCNGGLTNM